METEFFESCDFGRDKGVVGFEMALESGEGDLGGAHRNFHGWRRVLEAGVVSRSIVVNMRKLQAIDNVGRS